GRGVEDAELGSNQRRAGRETLQADRDAQRARRRAECLRQFRGLGRADAEAQRIGLPSSEEPVAARRPASRAARWARAARPSAGRLRRTRLIPSRGGKGPQAPKLLPPRGSVKEG